jgi:hypothetical protein
MTTTHDQGHGTRFEEVLSMSVSSRIAVAAALAGVVSFAYGAPAFGSSHAKSAAVTASYSCSASTPVGTQSYTGTASFTGTTPGSVAVGASVLITGFQASVSVPGSLLNEAYGYGVRSITTTVTAFDVSATDATTATIDVPKKPVNVGHLKLASSGNPSITISIPRKAAKVGSWIASQKGTMVFSPGPATIHFKTNLGSLTVQCTPGSQGSVLSTTTVS